MKKIAFITNGQARYLTHEWLHGYRRYISDHHSDIDLYIFHCFGNFSQDQSYNIGEHNIFRLPRLSDFDGILLDLALISDHELKEEIIIRARRTSVPVISLLAKVPDLYFSGIDNYHATCSLVEHLIAEHGCTKLNYVGGIIGNYENRQRFLAYRDTLRKHGIPFDPNRIYEHNYEVETGLRAFAAFQDKELLPDAFVCANDNIAAGVCLAAQEAGFSVPDNFLVTGFDNTTRAINFYPPITTVEFSKAHIMYNALGLLADIWNGTGKSSQVFSPTRCIYRESSGCTSLFPADPGKYVSSQIMAEVRQGNMLNWMMELDRFLLDCNSFTELADHLHTWLTRHECGSLYLLMNPDIFMLENVDSLPEVPDDIYKSIGYPDRMTVVYPHTSAGEAVQIDLSKGELLPDADNSETAHIYLFAPVHFREREIGYLILENCDYLTEHQFLFETLNTFATAIEALYGKLILRKKTKQLSQLYIHDSLTGLYNRMAYEKLALPLFQKCMDESRSVGILFIDADHLKYINDNFGHDMGNLAISNIASVIQSHCPLNAIAMRYGGDEFVCVIPGTDQEQLVLLEQQITDSLSVLSENNLFAFPIEASIGFVIADNPELSLNDYINFADEKMYASKKARRATRK